MSEAVPKADDQSINRRHRTWLVTVPCLAFVTVALGALFPTEVAGAYRVWTGSTAFSHCFLVAPLALYLVWERRDRLTGLAPRPAWLVMPLVPILSLAWLVAALLGVLELQQFVVVTLLEAVILLLLGWRIYAAVLGPALYLYLLVPTGDFLVPTLQDVTARWVVVGLRSVGVPVFSDGILIQIPAGSFVIAEACAGLRFLMASIAFGVFFSLLVYRHWPRRAAFIALSLIVPVLANVVRCFGIIYLAYLTNDVVAVEADHIIYGWGFFAVVMIVLIVIGLRFAEPRQRDSTRPVEAPANARPWFAPVAALSALALATIGPLYARVLDAPQTMGNLAAASAPAVAPPWSPLAADGWSPLIVAPDRAFRDGFSGDGYVVQRYVALYVSAGRHNNLVRSDNRLADETRWTRTGTGHALVDFHGEMVSVNTEELKSGGDRRLIWSFYVVDGKITASAVTAKLRQAGAALTGRSRLSAFVALAVEMQPGDNDPAAPLREFLAASEPLDSYLARLAEAAAASRNAMNPMR